MSSLGSSANWVSPSLWMTWRDVLVNDYAVPIVKEHPKGVAASLMISLLSCCGVCACCVAHRRRVRKAVRAAKAEINELQLQAEIRHAKGTVEGAGLTSE